MKVLQIAVGETRTVDWHGRSIETGIFKAPVDEPVRALLLALEGDRQADLRVHGGRDKAIYAYSDDYGAAWRRELGVAALEPAQFGHNLLVSGLTDDQVVIGTAFRIGGAEVSVTQPRIPCYKLGIRMGDDGFPARFWAAGRLGFYLRVDREGSITAGDRIETLAVPAHGLTVRRLYDVVNEGGANEARRLLDALPRLDAGWQRRLRRRLQPGNGESPD